MRHIHLEWSQAHGFQQRVHGDVHAIDRNASIFFFFPPLSDALGETATEATGQGMLIKVNNVESVMILLTDDDQISSSVDWESVLELQVCWFSLTDGDFHSKFSDTHVSIIIIIIIIIINHMVWRVYLSIFELRPVMSYTPSKLDSSHTQLYFFLQAGGPEGPAQKWEWREGIQENTKCEDRPMPEIEIGMVGEGPQVLIGVTPLSRHSEEWKTLLQTRTDRQVERTEAESVSVQTKIATAEEGETDVRREERRDMEKEVWRRNTRKGREKNPHWTFGFAGLRFHRLLAGSLIGGWTAGPFDLHPLRTLANLAAKQTQRVTAREGMEIKKGKTTAEFSTNHENCLHFLLLHIYSELYWVIDLS